MSFSKDVAYIIDSDGRRWRLEKASTKKEYGSSRTQPEATLYVENDEKEWVVKKEFKTDSNNSIEYKVVTEEKAMESAIKWMEKLEYGINRILVDNCRKEDVPDGDYKVEKI